MNTIKQNSNNNRSNSWICLKSENTITLDEFAQAQYPLVKHNSNQITYYCKVLNFLSLITKANNLNIQILAKNRHVIFFNNFIPSLMFY